jgi:hypothetical protein
MHHGVAFCRSRVARSRKSAIRFFISERYQSGAASNLSVFNSLQNITNKATTNAKITNSYVIDVMPCSQLIFVQEPVK